MIIMNLDSKEKAQNYGETCDLSMLPKLKEAQQVLLRFARQAQLQEKLGLAIDYAFRSQFLNEAIKVLESRS